MDFSKPDANRKMLQLFLQAHKTCFMGSSNMKLFTFLGVFIENKKISSTLRPF